MVLYSLLNREGELPYLERNALVKCATLLKPDLKEISDIEDEVFLKRISAFFNLTLNRNWCGEYDVSALKTLLK
ncbi:MAG: hypothetical protein Mars2KO_31770 [Maribacter sp.]